MGATGIMGITVATDIMAATATTHGVDAVAMDMAATDTTAAKQEQYRWQQEQLTGLINQTKSKSWQAQIGLSAEDYFQKYLLNTYSQAG